MKKTILILALVIGFTMTGQIVPYLKGGFDYKMANEGPHKGNDNFSDSSLDFEIQIGVEAPIENIPLRFGTAYQRHNEINYAKWTLLMVDYMLSDFPFKNINCYAGAEISTIYRWFDSVDYSDPYNYLHAQKTPMRFGVNAEIQWMPFDNLGISSHINLFEKEHDRWSKEPRWEVMVGLVFKLNAL